MNSKGQAALADAIYFLLIVSGLAIMLFYFSINHGNLVDEQLVLEFRSEYATSALKTMLYSSTPRVPGTALAESTEVDFLLAAIKEDYADNGEFDYMQGPIVNNVVAVMEPMADSFDYMYYIYIIGQSEFAFMMLYTSHLELQDVSGSGIRKEVVSNERAIYLCEPDSLNKLDDLLTGVGRVYQKGSNMALLKTKAAGGRGYDEFESQVTFAMWISTALPKLQNGNVLDNSHLNCECYRKLVSRPGCNPSNESCAEWKAC